MENRFIPDGDIHVVEKPLIFDAINKIMQEIGFIGKDSTCTGGSHFKYRGVDAVMNALNPALIKYKVFAVPTVLSHTREERTSKNGSAMIYSIVTVKYTFYACDGSYVDTVVVGEGSDTSDKSMNKALSCAFKYAMFQCFCIPTEELMDDPDKECNEIVRELDADTKQAVADARVQMKALGWSEEKVFAGRTLEQLNKSELSQAIGTIKAKYDAMLNKGATDGAEK